MSTRKYISLVIARLERMGWSDRAIDRAESVLRQRIAGGR